METRTSDILIVGAGQAGLSVSYFLSRNNRNHLVVDKGGIGNAWKQHRVEFPAEVNIVVLFALWQFDWVALDSQQIFDVTLHEVFGKEFSVIICSFITTHGVTSLVF